MARIIKERERIQKSYYEMCFYKDGEICFAFPMDENGEKVEPTTPECYWWENYQKCLERDDLVGRREKRVYTDVEPAVLECDCGNHVSLVDEFYGSCECPRCHQWYNLFGQKVLSPEKQMQCEDW